LNFINSLKSDTKLLHRSFKSSGMSESQSQCNNHSSCKKIFAVITTGATQPSGSYNFCYVQTSKVCLCRLEGKGRKRYGRTYSDCVSQAYAQWRVPASRTHFYCSGIWVNVPKGRYDAFFPRAVRSSVLFRVKELNPFNSGLDHVRSSRARI